ncbi:hypothetical protein WJ96_07325 [Burkholderia ubonensis]|uniref:VRR-NUC domain-containing protein n=1 Tax=Burkholderia ubonensis TaxID=101571 RepID=A0AAW3MUM6_9BURK|nr:hypothetical protein WJ93_09115 [Burkholderia ubonensis]KVP97079.1 hypothetical protein WJ97_14225 [Burkholderia ubonensis]KVP98424.1 hypothetical protein WJ96_07325 [Burkholderia ubonensis]KVZ93123.1 hypothetical protein WL25_18985 [Burkholderia ubonensis]
MKPEDVPKKARPSRARKNEAEGEEQAQLIKRFRDEYPDIGLLLIHIPNGGYRKNAFEGWRLKEQGVRAGVSDLMLPVARGGFFGLWIEFKAAPPNDAAVSDKQQEWVELMQAQGYSAHVCLGVDAAMKVLAEYLALPPTKPSRPRKKAAAA